MLPLMEIAKDENDHLLKDTFEEISNIFGLTDEEKLQLLPSGSAFVINNRISWARTYLTKAGLLCAPKRGFFKITESGKTFMDGKPKELNSKILRQFDSFNEFQTIKPKSEEGNLQQDIPALGENITPRELIENGYQTLKNELSSDLISVIKSITPSRFEKLVVDLLVKMGYGGSIKEAANVVGKSGDEGIDGIIKEDKLGLDVIYIQAKKWEGIVGRPEIQKFAGALLGKKAKKGIFITTSGFTAEAKGYVENIDAKIILIDGKMLTELMIENNLGVGIQDVFTIKRIDSDYFEEN